MCIHPVGAFGGGFFFSSIVFADMYDYILLWFYFCPDIFPLFGMMILVH